MGLYWKDFLSDANVLAWESMFYSWVQRCVTALIHGFLLEQHVITALGIAGDIIIICAVVHTRCQNHRAHGIAVFMVQARVRLLRYVLITAIALFLGYRALSHNVDFSDVNIKLKKDGHGDTSATTIPSISGVEVRTAAALAGPASTGYLSPPDFIEGRYVQRENATFVSLCRNSDLVGILASIRDIEDRFNHAYHYDWVFLNEEEFTEEFKRTISAFVSGNAIFAKIPFEHWSIPGFVDVQKARASWQKMKEENVIYGDSESYRHMCRFNSGFFYEEPALASYKYYWRVEPDIKIFCDIPEDPFRYMRVHDKVYGFTISMHEFERTIQTLWSTTKQFIAEHPEYVAENNAMKFLSDDKGETYNMCHFWSNFEIADLDFWRSPAYRDYFNYLDKTGGFFYERWGDAPIHSIAASLFLPMEKIHMFEDIGYYHGPYQSCPIEESKRLALRCSCPNDYRLDNSQRYIFTFKGWSCGSQWYDASGLKRPHGWEKYQEGTDF